MVQDPALQDVARAEQFGRRLARDLQLADEHAVEHEQAPRRLLARRPGAGRDDLDGDLRERRDRRVLGGIDERGEIRIVLEQPDRPRSCG